MKDWQRFVIEHGFRARLREMAAVLGRSVEEIEAVRRTGACSKRKHGVRFAELFSLWHGRPPTEDEWPPLRKVGAGRGYEWQAPELALLASLIGRLDTAAIAKVLTKRLREKTGDARARRTRLSVQTRSNLIGLQSSDVVGGIALREAAREIGSYQIVFNAVRGGNLSGFRVGRRWVIPRDAWEAWKSKRVFPPARYVQLSSIRKELGFRSDAKLPSYAKLGYVPTAVLCTPPEGLGAHWSGRGTWFIDPRVAAKLVADRRAGRPMPWFGKSDPHNLRVTFRLWQQRKHPAACETCAGIWGPKGAPRTFDDYERRYPPIAHGAKRHLTRVWSRGLAVADVARLAGRSAASVRRAIANGVLAATRFGRTYYVSKTNATRWKARGAPSGDALNSWVSIDTARKRYLFTKAELLALIAEGTLRSKVGTEGAMRGVTYVLQTQCAQLRETIGFTESEAARRAGVTVARLRTLLRGVDWRVAQGVPLVTVQAVIKRIQSKEGYSIEEAAAKLRVPVEWIHARKLDGTIRVARAKWDRRRLYVSGPMFERLKRFKRNPVKRERVSANALLLTQAAIEAGVSQNTIMNWVERGELHRRRSRNGWRYPRRAVRTCARRYWKNVRFHRATPPAWLQSERQENERTDG